MPTVLLVEDDPDNRRLLQVWLAAMGHQVHAAASAAEALSVLSEQGMPDIAIVDIVMPGINGLDLLAHLRRHALPAAHLPAILLTARELDSDQDDARALDASLMKKPLHRASLSAAIKRALITGKVLSANRAPDPAAGPGAASHPGVILLVDDNTDDVYLTRHAFQQNNITHQLVVARDGVEALALLLPQDGGTPLRPAIVLLDINMPRLSGLDVLARLRADPTTASLPVIVLTTTTHDRDLAQSYSPSATGYTSKPLTPDQFLQAAKALGVHWLDVNHRPTQQVRRPDLLTADQQARPGDDSRSPRTPP